MKLYDYHFRSMEVNPGIRSNSKRLNQIFHDTEKMNGKSLKIVGETNLKT